MLPGSVCHIFSTPAFNGQAMMLIAPVAVILVAENLGHLKAVAGMTGRNMDPYMGGHS
ncbi:transporter [Escherichia coli]|uniref:Transporter n=1 Tax=Escherichia coli TaxID=562 RepID=A0A376P3Z9_ECOLX|nr:transporter [Escherichia coli]